MAWENRNGKQYYYRKKRQNGHVISQYKGTGLLGELAQAADQEEKETRAQDQAAWQEEKKQVAALDQEVNQTLDGIRALIESYLLELGYHKVKGEWRKKRDA